jgi:hypothetical protein
MMKDEMSGREPVSIGYKITEDGNRTVTNSDKWKVESEIPQKKRTAKSIKKNLCVLGVLGGN